MHYAHLQKGEPPVAFPNTKEEAQRMAKDTGEKRDLAKRLMDLVLKDLQAFNDRNPTLRMTIEQAGKWEAYCGWHTKFIFFTARMQQYELLAKSLPTTAERMQRNGSLDERSFPMRKNVKPSPAQ